MGIQSLSFENIRSSKKRKIGSSDYDADMSDVARTLLEGDIGMSVDGIVPKKSGIPLRFLSRDFSVAWEKKVGDMRIRTRPIGDFEYEDLSEFESNRPLARHLKQSVEFVRDGEEMR